MLLYCPLGIVLGVLAVLLVVRLRPCEVDLERSLALLAKALVFGLDMMNGCGASVSNNPTYPTYF